MASVQVNDPRTPSVQIADELRAQIADGRWPPGSRLPSGRTLAKDHGVALMTAQAAIQRLRDEGLVFSTGRGYFVAGGDGEASRPTDPAYAVLAKDLAATKAEVRELANRVAALEGSGNR